jgi:hypothetical protein
MKLKMDSLKLISFLLINIHWLSLERECKYATIIYSGYFALVESIWYFIWHHYFYTTMWQFLMNIYFTYFCIYLYRKKITNWKKRILYMPLNLWLYEIIVGYYSIYIWGYNPAWDYTNMRRSMFHGTIRLDYLFVWWLLGIVIEVCYFVLLRILPKNGILCD